MAISAFQTPITIREAMENIHRRRYVLPAIQREFVWDIDQIIKLFDSLMKDYPIGSFLFWQVDKDKIKEFQFYEFLTNYHERDSTHNPEANVSGEENITAILDGQQRLTALYLGLKGTMTFLETSVRLGNIDAYARTKLYLNVLSQAEEEDMTYEFDFLTDEESSDIDENTHWFEVGKILDFKSLSDANHYLKENSLMEFEFAKQCLFSLFNMVNQRPIINYYLEKSQDLDKVLNIFIIVNSGGTKLDYSDLLFSISTAKWTKYDARSEITTFVDDINLIGDRFGFTKDFILKTSLILAELSNIEFSVNNFNLSNMRAIENRWVEIKRAIKLTVELVSSFGYNYPHPH